MPATYEIHISDVLTFKSCRRRWDLSSSLRRNLTPVNIYIPFFVGRIIHGALHALYAYGEDPLEVVDTLAQKEIEPLRAYPTILAANQDKIAEQVLLCKGILEHYLLWIARDRSKLSDQNFDVLNPEQAFSVPMRTLSGYVSRKFRQAGRIDNILRDRKTDELFLHEIKTTRSINERIKMLDLEEQPDAYCLAAQEILHEPVTGIVYTLIRKAIPEDPQILKNGMLSQNKQIDTTPEHYIAAARQHHGFQATNEFIAANYGDFLHYLLFNAKPFFQRVLIRRSAAQLQNARSELLAVAKEMTNPQVPIYHHGQPSCNWCLFREPCIAMQQGQLDFAEKLLRENYIQNTYHLRAEDEI